MRDFLRAHAKPRDIFFFLAGCAIAYHEVYVADEAEPLLIFTCLFLWGLIPAFWGDRAEAAQPVPPPDPPEPPDESGPTPGNQLTFAVAWNRATASLA